MAADSKNEVLKKPEIPDVQTLERVVKKHHERREYLRILRSTVASLLVVAVSTSATFATTSSAGHWPRLWRLTATR